MNEKLEAFRALVERDTRAEFARGGFCQAVTDSMAVSKVKMGNKYAKVDVGQSGKYIVELSTGAIYGIKAYGVIHRGHPFGTLDTINNYYWGGYRAVPKTITP